VKIGMGKKPLARRIDPAPSRERRCVRERMREIAKERSRLGYRRLAISLQGEGGPMNLKKM
jgi:hypothetical protein